MHAVPSVAERARAQREAEQLAAARASELDAVQADCLEQQKATTTPRDLAQELESPEIKAQPPDKADARYPEDEGHHQGTDEADTACDRATAVESGSDEPASIADFFGEAWCPLQTLREHFCPRCSGSTWTSARATFPVRTAPRSMVLHAVTSQTTTTLMVNQLLVSMSSLPNLRQP
jgi:hypothetical protein